MKVYVKTEDQGDDYCSYDVVTKVYLVPDDFEVQTDQRAFWQTVIPPIKMTKINIPHGHHYERAYTLWNASLDARFESIPFVS